MRESVEDLSANDVAARLRDAIQDKYRGSMQWGYFIDYFGDADSGDVIYSCGGDTCRAAYEMTGTAGAAKCIIDFDGAEDVVPRTVYEVEADEGDHLAAMQEAQTGKLYGDATPLYERYISKKERDSAGSKDFAGKGKSFPILKAGDVAAAAKALGRAGSGNYSTDVIKKNIIRIAKAKGFTSELPKAWQAGTDTQESQTSGNTGQLKLTECASTVETIELREAARADYEIKLIAPGKGASAWYPDDVLKRDGAAAFPAETKVYLNHPTASQESEGAGNRDVMRLAGVLTKPAAWKESHAKGPGLYASMKVFADHATTIEEKSKYLAMSISASGAQAVDTSGRMQFKEGLPVLAKLHEAVPGKNGNSVDVVPIGGAGGMILTESARGVETPTQEASTMPFTEEEVKLLRESVAANSAVTTTLLEAELRRQAIALGSRCFGDLAVPNETKEYLIANVIERGLPKKDGALDTVVLTEAFNSEASRFGAATGMKRLVTSMGASGGQTVQATEAERAQAFQARKTETTKTYTEAWADLFPTGTPEQKMKLAEVAVRGRAN